MALERQYSVAELADLWGCSKDHIYRLIGEGFLGSTDIGEGRAKTRIPESEAADYLKRNTRPARKTRAA